MLEKETLWLQAVYVVMVATEALYNMQQRASHRPTLTADLPETNLAFAFGYAVLMMAYAKSWITVTSYSYLMCLALCLVVVKGLLTHLVNYLSYKSQLRAAKKRKARTGEKTLVSLAGYSSLGSLGLAVLLHVYGFFVTGTAIGLPYYG